MLLENRKTVGSYFLYPHFIYPLLFLAVASIAIHLFDVDQIVADYFYKMEGYKWAWKNSWLTESVFHKGGRLLSILFAVTILLLLIGAYVTAQSKHQKPLLYLFLAGAGGSLLVSILKSSLAISCPWEFERYGGRLAYSDVFHQLFLRNGEGCFPAGHASAGYAWVALYFFGLCYQSKLRWAGLAIALLAGIVFGFAQQLRGAHFISHDLWTLATCWFFSLLLYKAMFKTNV